MATQTASPEVCSYPWHCDACQSPTPVEHLTRLPGTSLALCPRCRPHVTVLRRDLVLDMDHDDARERRIMRAELIEDPEERRGF